MENDNSYNSQRGDAPVSQPADLYDRKIGALVGLPDVINTNPATMRDAEPIMGNSQLFTVQTFRQKEKGDTIFVEHVSAAGTTRIVLPPKVAIAIARQRDALTARSRSKAGKAKAQARKDRGEQPGFAAYMAKRRSKAKAK
jgi:hypothetical protein